MNNRTIPVLLALFFGGLGALWLAERARVPTSDEARARSRRVLPELIDVAPADVHRVEVSGGDQTLVFERRGDDWRMTSPHDAWADRPQLDGLLTSLKILPRPIDAAPLK